MSLLLFAIYTKADAVPRSPQEIVAHAESRHGLPPGALSQVWSVECSRQTVPGPACRNHRYERGAFQMTEAAAIDVGCEWKALGEPGNFAYEADCGAAYLSRLLRLCGDIAKAQGAYNAGSRPDGLGPKCIAHSRYARKVAKR